MGVTQTVKVNDFQLSSNTQDFLRKMADQQTAAVNKQTGVMLELLAVLSQITNPGPSPTDVMLRGELGSRVNAIYEHCRACWEHEQSSVDDGETTPSDCKDSGCVFYKFRPTEPLNAEKDGAGR